MNEPLVLREDHGGVTVLTLNRPERRNAWTVPLQREYYGLLQRCVEDDSVRCIVVTGAGSTFCPGADTEALQVYSETGEFDPEMAEIEQPDWYPITHAQADDRSHQRCLRRLRTGPGPDV